MFPIEQGRLLLVPALDRDAADGVMGSEHIVKAYADRHKLTLAATAFVDLIKMSSKIQISIQNFR
jgi:hypothetical protein